MAAKLSFLSSPSNPIFGFTFRLLIIIITPGKLDKNHTTLTNILKKNISRVCICVENTLKYNRKFILQYSCSYFYLDTKIPAIERPNPKAPSMVLTI